MACPDTRLTLNPCRWRPFDRTAVMIVRSTKRLFSVFSLCSVCLRLCVYWSSSCKESVPAAPVVTLFIQPTAALDAQQPAGFGRSVIVFFLLAKHAAISSKFLDWLTVKCFVIESRWRRTVRDSVEFHVAFQPLLHPLTDAFALDCSSSFIHFKKEPSWFQPCVQRSEV